MKKIIKILILTTVLTLFSTGNIKAQHAIKPIDKRIVLVGDGYTDDTDALNAWGKGETVYYHGRPLKNYLRNGTFVISWRVDFKKKGLILEYNKFYWHYIGYDRTDWIHHYRGVVYRKNKIFDLGVNEPQKVPVGAYLAKYDTLGWL